MGKALGKGDGEENLGCLFSYQEFLKCVMETGCMICNSIVIGSSYFFVFQELQCLSCGTLFL